MGRLVIGLGQYACKDLNDKEMRWFYFLIILVKMHYNERGVYTYSVDCNWLYFKTCRL